MAQPLDLRKLDLTGEPAPIAEQVSEGFSASLTGTLVYSSGGSAPGTGQLTLFGRQGKILGAVGEPGNYESMALSPDEKHVVASRDNLQSGNANLWMMDLARGISTRFTFDSGRDLFPLWSPDGSRIAFSSIRGGQLDRQ